MMTASKLFARALLLASAALIAVGTAHAQAPGDGSSFVIGNMGQAGPGSGNTG